MTWETDDGAAQGRSAWGWDVAVGFDANTIHRPLRNGGRMRAQGVYDMAGFLGASGRAGARIVGAPPPG